MTAITQSWIFWAILSTFCYGVHAFLYKKTVEEKGDLPTLQVINPTVVIIASLIICIIQGVGISAEDWWKVVIIASLQGMLFFMTSVGRAEALHLGVPSHIVFPLLKTSAPIVILLSAYVFSEWKMLLEPSRLLGVILAVVATFILMDWRLKKNALNKGLGLVVLAILSSAGASLATKYVFVATVDINIFSFILISNLAALVMASLWSSLQPKPKSLSAVKISVRYGLVMGLLSFVGFTAFLKAISLGHLSFVVAVSTLYIFIPILLSAWLYREHINSVTRISICLSVIAVALLG